MNINYTYTGKANNEKQEEKGKKEEKDELKPKNFVVFATIEVCRNLH